MVSTGRLASGEGYPYPKLNQDPEVVLVEQVLHGINTASTTAFSFPGIVLLRIRDGQIVSTRDYMDALGVAQAMNRPETIIDLLADRFSP